MGEIIDLLLETAGYLDSHHDDEAANLRRKLRDRAEQLFIEHALGEPVPDVPFVEGDAADLLESVAVYRYPPGDEAAKQLAERCAMDNRGGELLTLPELLAPVLGGEA